MSALVAFRMQLKPGCAVEYERRHNCIWPELTKLLHDAGIENYSIFLDEESQSLFAVMQHRPDFSEQVLLDSVVMRRWWDYMADLMIVQDDHRPLQLTLREVFRMSS